MYQAVLELPPNCGFSLDMCRRNQMLSEKAVLPPSYRKTGTTILSLNFQIYPHGSTLYRRSAICDNGFWFPLLQ
ncbi:hypothetical protein TorRG33x02_246900 [Trema orientale]|uniref:Uncharacterized protein n=1 Tax=Trema orientale TaxID=63057 RepID=A0A2P5DN00_TREOI|nr:hypothetical protein TorRG33x02_246900 [Trema orientale]